MAATLPPPRLLPSGDSAVTVEFSRTIDDAANQRVLALDKALAASPIDGITETVPTYRSLLVHYDPGRISFDALGEKILPIATQPLPPVTKARRWRIPVAYGGAHLIAVSRHNNYLLGIQRRQVRKPVLQRSSAQKWDV